MGHKQDLDITFNALETRKNGDNSWTELNSMENLQKQIHMKSLGKFVYIRYS